MECIKNIKNEKCLSIYIFQDSLDGKVKEKDKGYIAKLSFS